MLCFLPFYSFKVTERIHSQIVNQSWTTPAFIFCFSPYCGHCKEIHPYFTQVMDEFKFDPRVILAEVDCNKHGGICTNFYHVTGYPTFQTLLKGIPKVWDGGRDLSTFRTYTNDLKSLKMDELCKNFDNMKKEDIKYPAIVINHPGNLKESCAYIDKVSYNPKIIDVNDNFYVRTGKASISCEIYLNNESKVELKHVNSKFELIKFIGEYKIPNFAIVKWDVVFAHKRALCIVISNDGVIEHNMYNYANMQKDYFWISVTYKKFKELSEGSIDIKENELPVVLVTNTRKTKYVLVRNATVEKLSDVVNKDFSTLKDVKRKYLKFIFRDLIIFPGKKINRRAIGITCVIAIAIFVGYFIHSLSLDTYYKFE